MDSVMRPSNNWGLIKRNIVHDKKEAIKENKNPKNNRIVPDSIQVFV